MATASAPMDQVGKKPSRLGPIIIVVATIVLLIFAFIEIMPFVLTVANSFKCQASIQNAVGAIIPVPPSISCVDENGSRRPLQEMVNGVTFNPTADGYSLIFNENLPRWLFNTVFCIEA